MSAADDKMRRDRDRKAESLGAGAWMNKAGIWCQVEVTFYPSIQLWITEEGERRPIKRAELERDYSQLAL